jgi:hypothetical protein
MASAVNGLPDFVPCEEYVIRNPFCGVPEWGIRCCGSAASGKYVTCRNNRWQLFVCYPARWRCYKGYPDLATAWDINDYCWGSEVGVQFVVALTEVLSWPWEASGAVECLHRWVDKMIRCGAIGAAGTPLHSYASGGLVRRGEIEDGENPVQRRDIGNSIEVRKRQNTEGAPMAVTVDDQAPLRLDDGPSYCCLNSTLFLHCPYGTLVEEDCSQYPFVCAMCKAMLSTH